MPNMRPNPTLMSELKRGSDEIVDGVETEIRLLHPNVYTAACDGNEAV